MDDVSLCESSDWFANNVYAEVNANDDDDRTPNANNNNYDLTNSSVSTVATATLALPDDDDDTDDQVHSSIVAAGGVLLSSVPGHDGEVENLYECGTTACRGAKIDHEVTDSKESLSSDTVSKTNKFFTSLSRSLRSKLKQKPALMSETFETAVDSSEASSCQPSNPNAEEAIESDSAKSVPTLAVRLREKLRKFNFVKIRPNSDEEVSSNAWNMAYHIRDADTWARRQCEDRTPWDGMYNAPNTWTENRFVE